MGHGNVQEGEEVEKDLLEVAVLTRATKEEVRRELHRATGGHTSLRFRLGTTGVSDDAHGDVSSILDLAGHLQANDLEGQLHSKKEVNKTGHEKK